MSEGSMNDKHKEEIQKHLPQGYEVLEVTIPDIKASFHISVGDIVYYIEIDLTPEPEQAASIIAQELVNTLFDIDQQTPKSKMEIN